MDGVIPYADIVSIKLSPLDSEDNRISAQVYVLKSELLHNNKPEEDGLYDSHMGTTDIGWTCGTCMQSFQKCPGHFGALKLNYPVFSPMYMKAIVNYLKIICFKCGKVIVNFSLPSNLNPTKILNYIVKLTRQNKKKLYCVHCGAEHAYIEKDKNDNVRIIMKFYDKDDVDPKKEKEVKKMFLYPNEVKTIFGKINIETLTALKQKQECHPSKFILTILRIPPNTMRPDLKKIGNARSNSDDLTIYLQNIFNINSELQNIVNKSSLSGDQEAKVYGLNLVVYEFIRGSTTQTNKKTLISSSKKALTSITGRWPGKWGRVRRNLNGRRVSVMARSYITCDTTLRLNELGVPLPIAKGITTSMIVQEYNYKEACVYYNNGTNVYPGSKTVKKADGRIMDVDIVNKKEPLEYGDELSRNFIDGDVINFNRAPSLESSSISSLRVRTDRVGFTIKMNIGVCALFNADFDGDAMNIQFPGSARTMYEIENLSGIHNFFISYKTGSPKIGLEQDSLSGLPCMTYDDFRISKYYAMQLFNRCHLQFDFSDLSDILTGRDLITLLLKKMNLPINYSQTAQIYDAGHSQYVKFDQNDIDVKIVNGTLESGILDKKSIGAVNGSIFHVINNQHGPHTALNVIHNMQELGVEAQLNIGMTVSIRDFILPSDSLKQIRKIENKVLYNSYQITERLYAGLLVPPLGVTIDDHYEKLQLNELRKLGDDLLPHVLTNVNLKYNNLYRLIMFGAKGSFVNYLTITSAIGQLTINDQRMPLSLSGRSLSYFTMDDPDPAARGYIGNSYITGLDITEFIFHAMESRNTLVITALQTATTGNFNRQAIKNFESLIVNNMRQVVNNGKISQLLYGGDGVDTRSTYHVPLPHCDKSADINDYHSMAEEFPKFNNKEVQKLLDEEWKALVADRKQYMDIFIRWERISGTNYTNVVQLPTNIKIIVENKVRNFEYIEDIIDPVESIKLVREFCEYIPYILVNDIQYKKKAKLAQYHYYGLLYMIMAVRVYLCTHELLTRKINITVLKMIIEELTIKILLSQVNYGRSVGILAAQAYSEPLTQMVLSAKRTSGVGGKRVGIDRVQEILGMKPANKMKEPGMELRLIEEFESDKFTAYEVMHHIEMLKLGEFITETCKFYEEYKKIRHSKYKHEIAIIEEFEKYNPRRPSNLVKFCIRIGFNKYKLIEKQIYMDLIRNKIKREFPGLYLVYTPDNVEDLFMRIYIPNNYLKEDVPVVPQLETLEKNIKNIILRGIDGIINAQVFEANRSIEVNGKIITKKIYKIYTLGVNIRDILRVPYIDKSAIYTDSLLDYMMMYDIVATRNRIITDMRSQTSTANFRHVTVYADEMTYMGYPTSVDRYGSAKRTKSFMLRISDASPKEVIETAALRGMTDSVTGLSAPVMLGKNPNIGVTYNSFVVDEEYIDKNVQNIDELLD